ncbi:hypothetical protein E3P94_03895 [Wallemia ichthyophaga]|nr:hypothetical protein E3P95_03899 [Wallemia ichthyophaga]TIA95880.1 hypothetical protein E3P94_03895 [Wallemia ichthyophaga]
MTDVVLPAKIPTFSSLFTKYAPHKSRLVGSQGHTHSHSQSHSTQNPSFNLMKLPNELVELITDELSFNKKLLTSCLNRRLRLITMKKIFNCMKLTHPIDSRRLDVIGRCVKHLTITYNPPSLFSLSNLKSIQYVSNDPLSAETLTQFSCVPKLHSLTLDVTILQPSSTLPNNLKHLKLSFRDDKDVHGNDPPHNMEIFSEDQIWHSIVLMSKLVEANAATLEKLHLKLLLPIHTLSSCLWPCLKELTLVRSFPNPSFEPFLANAPRLETLLIHGRPNNQYWIGQLPNAINAPGKLLNSLKHLTLAATPIAGDNLFAHLNTNLHSFTIEDQLSTRSAYLVVHSLATIQLHVLRVEPLATTLDWLMTVADTLPTLRELHCRYSRLRKLPSQSLSMFVEILAKMTHLRHLSLGWDLDDECGDAHTSVEHEMTIKQNEFYHNLAFLSSINSSGSGSGSGKGVQPMEQVDSSSTTQTQSQSQSQSQFSTESPQSACTEITTPVSEMSSPGVALSPSAGTGTPTSTVDSMRDDLRRQWNRRSNARYWTFAESVSKRIPALETLNVKRYNVLGEREEITFHLAAGRVRAGRWASETAFPTTSHAFLL